MEEKRLIETEPIDITLSKIGDRYGQLRIVNPASDLCVLKSMEKYGQLSPVVVCRAKNNEYELIDGFKRLRAARKLNKKCLNAKVLNIGVHAGKAAILQLNWVGKSISQMEEAMVLHSLYRENGLRQVEIAILLSRHKSWVCRRICLIEQLDDEVKESIKLGLIKVSVGWKLARLQRCNQEAVLSAIQKHRLTVRQTQELISSLLSRPRCEHEAILRSPKQIIHHSHHVGKAGDNWLSQAGVVLIKKLRSMQQCCLAVVQGVRPEGLSHLSEGDILCLSPQIGESIRSAQDALDNLKKTLVMGRPKLAQEKEDSITPRASREGS
jgi:ParB/RepB/Spo0J family partition protein